MRRFVLLMVSACAAPVDVLKLSSPDEAWSKVKPFVADHKINYPILMGDSSLLGAFELRFLPATFLIDKQGRIAATYAGVVDKADVDSNITKLLAEQ